MKTVLVDGEILKEDFKLEASLDAPRRAVEASVTTCSKCSAIPSRAGCRPALGD